MRYQRSTGTTTTERLLAKLCEKSFLSLWSYPNLCNDRGKDRTGSGQELCDLLVVFNNDIVIFSDKSCAYPCTDDELVNWKRYYKKAIKKSADQIYGAERWLKEFPDRIFLDKACRAKFPFPIGDRSAMRVHRVLIALGAIEKVSATAGINSLILKPSVIGDEKFFTFGSVSKDSEFIHILDESSLHIVLTELSTVSDFVEYLSKKEDFFKSGRLIQAASENDLLALYLKNAHTFPRRVRDITIETGHWKHLSSNEKYRMKKDADRLSLFWDNLIEHFNKYYNARNLERGNDLSFSDYERVIRIMAAEDRLFRRALSQAFVERISRAKAGYVASIIPSKNKEITYVLLVGPGPRAEEYDDYRRFRTASLYQRCLAAKAARPMFRYIVGLAFDAEGVSASSEDIIFLDTSNWSLDELEEARKIRREFGYFQNSRMKEQRMSADEYPPNKYISRSLMNRKQRRQLAKIGSA